MKLETRTYKLTGITPILGSRPANPEIHGRFVAAKAASLQKQAEEEAMLPGTPELEKALQEVKESGLTVFLRGSHGEIVIPSYVIKGFFKSAFGTLRDQFGISGPKGKVDNLVFVAPEYIQILDGHGEPQTEPDGLCERSLRAETMQGPRVALQSSEQVIPPWSLTVEITVVENNGTGKSKPVTFHEIEESLDYGRLKGLGQWRNAGYGSFTWERIG